MIFALTSCSLIAMFLPYDSGKVTTSTIYDLETKTEMEWGDADQDDADLVLEPWYDNDGPAPALQMYDWGGNATFILDLGAISIDDALNLSDDELIPDPIEWDVYVEEGHTYYIITSELNEYYLYVNTVDIDEDANGYDATVKFDFMEK